MKSNLYHIGLEKSAAKLQLTVTNEDDILRHLAAENARLRQEAADIMLATLILREQLDQPIVTLSA